MTVFELMEALREMKNLGLEDLEVVLVDEETLGWKPVIGVEPVDDFVMLHPMVALR